MPKRRPRKVPSAASGSAAPVSCSSGLRVLPFDHTWQPGGGQVRHKCGHPSSPAGCLQRSTEPKIAVLPRLYEAQTCAPTGRRCYGPRLVKAHSTSDAARLAAVFTGLLLLASVPVALAAGATGPQSAGAGLQARSGSLEARAAAATLELYSLESQLGRARTDLAEIDARREALARERASAQTQLTVARQALLTSQSELSNLARTLYQQSGSDPLAVVLGARSLDEAMAGLDGIAAPPARTTGSSSRRARRATRLSGLSARLAERDAELEGLAAAAEARAASLEATAAQRRGLIGELRRQQGLNAARIAAIEAQATDGRDTDDRPRGRIAAAGAVACRSHGADGHPLRASAHSRSARPATRSEAGRRPGFRRRRASWRSIRR